MTNTDLIERLKKLRARPAGSLTLFSDYELLSEAIAALESRPAGVAVKKLEWWHVDADVWWMAQTPIGGYAILDRGDKNSRFRLDRDERIGIGQFDTLEEAQAAAQADFDQRVRSVIEPSPGIETPAVGEAEAVAWQRQLERRKGEWTVWGNVSRRVYHEYREQIAKGRKDARVRELIVRPPAPASLATVLIAAKCYIISFGPLDDDRDRERYRSILAEIDAALTAIRSRSDDTPASDGKRDGK